MKSVYVTDSAITEEGHGGGVVSFHELRALQQITEVRNVYQRMLAPEGFGSKLHLETVYPRNPFMYDYYIASLPINTDEIQVAMFYGHGMGLTMKRFSKAKKFCTIAAHNLEVSLEEWKNFGFEEPPPAHLTDEWVFNFSCKGIREEIDVIICPSQASADFVKRRIVPNKRIEIIPHGTDLPQNWSNERTPFRVFHLAGFGHDKGQIYLLAAWATSMLDRKDASLTLAGSEFFRDFVPAILGHYPSSIECFAHITPEVKHAMYQNASVYVQSSVTEGFGLTVLEAMAHGTPVIVTKGAGASDIVEDGKDGFVVPIRSAEAIAAKLIYLYENPSEVKRMGGNARKKAEQYAWQIIEQKYVSLIREVAEI